MEIIRRKDRKKKRYGCKIKPNLGNMIKLSAKIDEVNSREEPIHIDDILDCWNKYPKDMVESYRKDWNLWLDMEPDIFIHPK